jgi:hypothetical protein
LAGYTSGVIQDSIWKELCRNLGRSLQQSYLRVIFTLASSDEGWPAVLTEKGLPLTDRLAIALRYLDDDAVSPNDSLKIVI